MRDRMLHSRFELKYHLAEEQAVRVRDFVQSHLDLDEFSAGKPNFSYSVHSLYLDSDDLKTYWATVNGNKNRFKLRLRYYTATPTSPVFFEIKRRMDRTIHKDRGAIRSELAPRLLAGHFPEENQLLSDDARQLVALQLFAEHMQRLQAVPKVHVAYEREAYVSDDDSHRVTIDRSIRAEPNLDGVIRTDMDAPISVYPGHVVLELKFTNRFPNWFRQLVETFDLMQGSAAKYVEGVSQIGHAPLACPIPVEAEPVDRPRGDGEGRVATRRRPYPQWVADLE
jgi:SPX domain protein involved in polyphosphate accumulation